MTGRDEEDFHGPRSKEIFWFSELAEFSDVAVVRITSLVREESISLLGHEVQEPPGLILVPPVIFLVLPIDHKNEAS